MIAIIYGGATYVLSFVSIMVSMVHTWTCCVCVVALLRFIFLLVFCCEIGGKESFHIIHNGPKCKLCFFISPSYFLLFLIWCQSAYLWGIHCSRIVPLTNRVSFFWTERFQDFFFFARASHIIWNLLWRHFTRLYLLLFSLSILITSSINLINFLPLALQRIKNHVEITIWTNCSSTTSFILDVSDTRFFDR